MPSTWWYKVVAVTAMVLVAVGVLIPTFFEPDEDDPDGGPGWYRWYTENIYGQTLTRGLDLQGGLHLQYQVDVDKAVALRLETFGLDLQDQLEEEGQTLDFEVLDDETSIRIEAANPEALTQVEEIVTNTYPLDVRSRSDSEIVFEMREDEIQMRRSWVIDTAIATIRDRVDGLGVTEPSITRRGETDIVVQLPGLGEEDFEAAKELIGTTARLEFHGIHDENGSYWQRVVSLMPETGTLELFQGTIEARTLEEVRTFGALLEDLREGDPNAPPADAIIGYEEQISYHPQTGQVLDNETRYRMILLKSRVELTGETISDVRPAADPQTNRPFVSITFDAEGGETFCRVTTEYNQQILAIVLDDIVKSTPIIEEPICAGRARINMGSTGSYDALYREVENLVIVLAHGQLPADLEPQFETQVGPSLGEASIRQGTIAMAVGSLLVVAFMAFYYRRAGMIANLALIFNVLFVLTMLVMFGATLTLPGIAGIVLTVGMAVDANIIIFERIREELRLGKTPRDAVNAGYSKALWTILDANITTAIAGFVLMQYGSGPVRGFAVTLILGIISSVFTALVITRMIFDYRLTKSRVQRLSI